jgi:hypothetical protein
MSPDAAANLGFTHASVPHAAELGARMGHDFSSAQAFFGRSATQACNAVDAEVFTVGNRIAFRRSAPSKQLVAHELVHVAQQGAGLASKGHQSRLEMTSPGDALERQADNVAAKVVTGESVQLTQSGGTQLARDAGVTAGLVMGAVAIVQSQVNAVSGELSYNSDQITYPPNVAQPIPQAKSVDSLGKCLHRHGSDDGILQVRAILLCKGVAVGLWYPTRKYASSAVDALTRLDRETAGTVSSSKSMNSALQMSSSPKLRPEGGR